MGEAQRRYYERQKEAKRMLEQLRYTDPAKYRELMERVNRGESTVKVWETRGIPVTSTTKYVHFETTEDEVKETTRSLLDWAREFKDDVRQMRQDIDTAVAEGLEGIQNAANDVISKVDERARNVVIEELKNRLPVEHILKVDVNGVMREIKGHPHSSLPKLIQVLGQRLHVFLVGPAGSGKTTAAKQVAEAFGLSYYEHSCGPATSQWDLMGFLSPDGKYVKGWMRDAYEHGGVFMLDEIDNTNPSVLTALNSALANGYATFPDGRVEKHPDFICIAAGNTYGRGADRLYVGRNQLDAATLDRFIVINWDYDEEAEKDWAGLDQIEWVHFVQRVRAVAIQHKMRVVVSPRASINGAKLLRAGMNVEEVAEMVLWKGMSADDRDKIAREVL